MIRRFVKLLVVLQLFSLTCFLHVTGHAAEVEFKYITRPGDSLSNISGRYMLKTKNWQELAAYNQLPNANLIQPGITLSIPAPWLSMKSAPALLKDYAGDVKVGHIERGWKQAKLGMSVQTGQYIKLGHNSSGQLELADHSLLILQPNTLLQLDTLSLYADGFMSDTKFRLQSGRIEVQANRQKHPFQTLEVITPSAVTAVRGTQFIVEASASQTITQTTEGKVEVMTDKGSEFILQGYGTLVASGERPRQPTAISSAPVLDIKHSKFTQFPIKFSIENHDNNRSYVSQASLDELFSKVISEVRTTDSEVAIDVFDNGHYFLRLWSVDRQGIPSKSTLFPFEVAVQRQLLGHPIKIAKANFSSGFISLNLPKIKEPLNYMIRLTTDIRGKDNIWHLINPDSSAIHVPKPVVDADHYYFWVYAYK